MKRTRVRVLLVVGLVVGVVLGAFLGMAVWNPGSGDSVTSSNVTYGAPDGLNVTLTGTTQVDGETLFPDSRTVSLTTTSGNLTLAASDTAAITVDESELIGTFTNATGITAGSTWIELNPEDKQQVAVRGDVESFNFSAITLDDGAADFVYDGPNGGTAQVNVTSLPANTPVVATDSTTGDYLDHATTDGSGTLMLTGLPLSKHSVSLQTANNATPLFSNPDPAGLIPDTPNELAVDISDADFPADEINVTISLDGTQIHSETVTSAGTVTAPVNQNLDLEGHQWTVNATDTFGNFNSETYQFSLPTNITIRNELNASEKFTGANLTATFYSSGGNIVVERTDSNNDGNISMRGLPNTDFVVTTEGNNFYQRRIYIESIGDQRDIYLLNKTEIGARNTTETIFTYEDRTTRFEQSVTTLEVQRALDKDNDDSYDWQTVAGDFWGAAGEFPFIGETNARYRLVITNRETGDRRVLGTHIPTADGVKEIIVGKIDFTPDDPTGTWFDARLNGSTGNLQIQYTDPANSTDELTVFVYERGNRSNWILNRTAQGPLGTQVFEAVLTDDQRDKTWIVEFRDGNGNIVGQIPVGSGSYGVPFGGGIVQSLALIGVVFIGSLYGPRTALMGAWAVVGFSGLLLMLGWLSVPVAGLTVAAMIAGGATIYREAIPT